MMTAEHSLDSADVDRVASVLDGEARDLLQVAAEGDAYTARIRRETGLSRQAIMRRVSHLEERGIVVSEIDTPAAGGQPQRHVHLTEFGQRLVEAGLLDKITDTNSNVRGLHQRLDELEADLRDALDNKPDHGRVRTIAREAAESATETLPDAERIDTLEQTVDELESQIRRNTRRSDLRELEERIESIEEELKEEIENVRNLAMIAKSDVRELKE